MARETIWLSRKQRGLVDRELAPRLEALGDRQVEAEAKRAAYRLDPVGFTERVGRAESERRVGLRPAPDAMARLGALLPVRDGVAAYATLCRDADAIRAAGDPRGRGQVMADLLVERLTGRAPAVGMPVEVEVVLPAESLVDARSAEPAHVPGYGPVPGRLARQWLLGPEVEAPVWLRRLFADPVSGRLVGMESRRRRFTKGQARFLRLRDQTCRTPYCGAPVRHADHVVPAAERGPTAVANGQGLCEACNYAKSAPGWRARPGPVDVITINTPTGHTYSSRAPDPPGGRRRSLLEHRAIRVVYTHTHAA